MAKPKSSQKSSIAPILNELMDELVEQASKESDDRKQNKQCKWVMPPKKDWSGNLFKWKELDKPFDSEKPNKELVDAIKDPENPGNAGDLINTNTQIEYLAMMERAFRARHTMTFPRGVAHCCARRNGQSKEGGPLKRSVLKYLEDLQKMSAGNL